MESQLTTVMALSALVVSVLVASKVVNVSESTTNIDQSSVVYVTGGLTKNTQADNETAITLDTNITDIQNAAYGAVYTLADGTYTGQTKTIVAKMPVDVYVQTGWGTMKLEADHSGGEHIVSLYWDGKRWEVSGGSTPSWHAITTKQREITDEAGIVRNPGAICTSSDGSVVHFSAAFAPQRVARKLYNSDTSTYDNATYTDVSADYTTAQQYCASSSSGSTVVFGAFLHSSGVGAVSVYKYTAGSSTPSSYGPLTPSDVTGGAAVGTSVDISADGTVVVAGAPLDDTGEGAVWTFEYNEAGDNYTQTGLKLVPIDATGSGVGSCVAMTPDAQTLVVFGYTHSSFEGGYWIFTRSSDGVGWDQQTNVTLPTGGEAGGGLGTSCGISNDASVIIGGATGTNGNVYVWRRNHGTAWEYTQDPAISYAGTTTMGLTLSSSGTGNTFSTNKNTVDLLLYRFDTSRRVWLDPVELTDGNLLGSSFQQAISVSNDGRTVAYSDDSGASSSSVYILH